MIYFTAHTFNCVCHCLRVMFRVLGMYNFDFIPDNRQKIPKKSHQKLLSLNKVQVLNDIKPHLKFYALKSLLLGREHN